MITRTAHAPRSGRRPAAAAYAPALPAALLAAALLAFAAAPAIANPALDTRYGNPAASLSPETDAMAGAGAALYRGGFSTVLNPACLSAETGARLDAAIYLAQEHEDRLAPLFDSFGSYVTDTAIASNRHHYFGTGLAAVRRLGRGARPITAALSLTDRYGFAYDFAEDLLDPNPFASPRDALLYQRAVEVDGALRALSGGAAVELRPGWSLGAALHYSFGTRAETRRVRDYRAPQNSYRLAEDFEQDGVNATLGALLRIDARLDVGFAYETPLSASGTATLDTLYASDPVPTVRRSRRDRTVDYPGRYRAGLVYRPRTDPRTTFTVDAVLTPWSDLEDSWVPGDDNPLGLHDTWDVRIGLEHLFRNGVPVRFGWRRLDSYADREAGALFFTAGTGFPAAGGAIAVAAELGKVSSEQDNWFAYPAGYAAPGRTRVENTVFRLGAGFTRSF